MLEALGKKVGGFILHLHFRLAHLGGCPYSKKCNQYSQESLYCRGRGCDFLKCGRYTWMKHHNGGN